MLLPAPAFIAVGLVIALLVLLPARRLQHAGFGSRAIGSYALCLWALAFLLAIRPGATRFLIPILLIAYLAPFVAAPERLGRIVRRGGRGGRDGRGDGDDLPKPPMKNVTPPDGPIEPG